MTSQAWMTLFHNNKKIEALLKDAKAIKASSPYFCARGRWLTGMNGPCLKDRVKELTEGNIEAYKVASREIYFALPDCKDCFCLEIGLIPKSSKFIKITQRLMKLSELGQWCNNNPQKTNNHEGNAKRLISELQDLKIDKLIAESVFIFGGIVDEKFLNQLKDLI
jgi:hypothetical protein